MQRAHEGKVGGEIALRIADSSIVIVEGDRKVCPSQDRERGCFETRRISGE